MFNYLALTHEERIFPAYQFRAGAKIWIVTEAGRSVTTILLLEEY